MRVLVAYASKRGGTAGIAETIGEQLMANGCSVEVLPARKVRSIAGFDAVVVGGALYASRWHRHARRLLRRKAVDLRKVPVWLFSSGPLSDSADETEIPPVPQVAELSGLVGARAHATFGGRLAPDAKGFPASAMAKNKAGDWRNPDRIRAWADTIATATKPPASS